MSQTCFFLTYYCYKIGDEWKRNSLNRRRKSRDILRYTFRIAIRYRFLVYCDISIYCDTPITLLCGYLEGWSSKSCLTIPVGWLLLLQLTVRNRCVIEVFGGIFVLSIGCRIFSWYGGFRHRTESDLLFFLPLLSLWNLRYGIFQS